MRKALPTLVVLLLAADMSGAATYEVGVGRAYPTIGSVRWSALVAGDVVRIHPGTYHEKLDITVRGTAERPIIIEGVPDETGKLPVIDGTNATTGSHYAPYRNWTYGSGLGLIYVGLKNDYLSKRVLPGYLTLRNLRVQGAKTGVTYRDKDGQPHVMGRHSAIYLQSSERVLLENLEVTDSDQGIFANSSGAIPPVRTDDLTIRSCRIWGNGLTTSYLVHNTYVEAAGVVYEHNWFGPPRAGALGNNVKDRSSGVVFRYNWVHNGAHLLDLVECQEGCGSILNDTTYRETFVYGNVFLNTQVDPDGGAGGAVRLFHYASEYNNPRAGTLYFYDNTVVVRYDLAKSYRIVMFQLSDNVGTVDVRNNIFFLTSHSPGSPRPNFYWKDDSPVSKTSNGNLVFGKNLVSPGWQTHYRDPTGGQVLGLENLVTITNNDPGFVSVDSDDFRPAKGSQAVGTAGPLAAKITQGNHLGADLTPSRQYVKHARWAARTTTVDVGALQQAP